LCVLTSCSVDGTQCINTSATCPQDTSVCITTACNPSTGLCESLPVSCADDASDLCTSASCDDVTGCVNTTVSCPTPTDLCVISTGCDPLSGGCGTSNIDCDDGVFCTVDSCDSTIGCIHTPNNTLCDDPNPCTNYSQCVPDATGVYFCNSTAVDCGGEGLFCSNLSCVDFFGCSNTPRDCRGNASNKSCTTYNCSETKQACETIPGVCFNFLGVVVGIVVGGLIGGLIGAAAFIAGVSAGGAAAAYSSSASEHDERAVHKNPLFQEQGKGADVKLGNN